MRIEAKSVVFGRKPRKDGDEFKTAFFKIYDKVNPMTEEVMESFPKKELDFPNIKCIVMKNQDMEYYLEGNDLVLDNISSIEIEEKDNELFISVEK